MKLDEIKALLEDAKLTEAQVKAFDAYMENFALELKKKYSKAFNESESGEMIPKKIAEKAFNQLRQDSKVAFELIQEDYKKSFDALKADYKKSFELYAEDKANEYSEHMINALQELYGDVEERVKKNFFESNDAKVLNDVKKIMTPLIASKENQTLLEEVERLKSINNALLEDNESINRDRTINALVKDFPEEYSETVKEFIDGAKSEDEILERFTVICEMIEKGVINKKVVNEEKKPVVVKPVVEEVKTPVKKTAIIKNKTAITEELNKGIVQSVKSKSTDKVKKVVNEEDDNLFTKDEQDLLDLFSY